MPRFLVIEARYYTEIADALLQGVDAALVAAGATYDVVTTSGAYELPATLNFAVQGTIKYDGFILLGCVIRGQTTHYDQILDAVFPKILDLSVEHNLALGMGVLTCENEEQAEYRADKDKKDYGGAAARAALRMVQLKNQYLQT
ncbi:MAG: ribH [Alphaproteobacteria bacterium]|nr:ribH [Alphaproteobacteria bacterium]